MAGEENQTRRTFRQGPLQLAGVSPRCLRSSSCPGTQTIHPLGAKLKEDGTDRRWSCGADRGLDLELSFAFRGAVRSLKAVSSKPKTVDPVAAISHLPRLFRHPVGDQFSPGFFHRRAREIRANLVPRAGPCRSPRRVAETARHACVPSWAGDADPSSLPIRRGFQKSLSSMPDEPWP